jgi:hypothetical protein
VRGVGLGVGGADVGGAGVGERAGGAADAWPLDAEGSEAGRVAVAVAFGGADESAVTRDGAAAGADTNARVAPATKAATPAAVMEAAENGTGRRMCGWDDTRNEK